MKLKMTSCNTGEKERTWDEVYENERIVDQESAGKYAQKLIDNFNDTLRPYEKHRTLLKVEFIDTGGDGIKKHIWVKMNLFTLKDQYGLYDKMKCKECRITGKRYGNGSGGITLDSKYKAKIYQNCLTAKVQREKVEARGIKRENEKWERARNEG